VILEMVGDAPAGNLYVCGEAEHVNSI
jgi:hypothetical protein